MAGDHVILSRDHVIRSRAPGHGAEACGNSLSGITFK